MNDHLTVLLICAIGIGAWLILAIGAALAFGLKAAVTAWIIKRSGLTGQRPPQP
jgi:hypothetical protein